MDLYYEFIHLIRQSAIKDWPLKNPIWDISLFIMPSSWNPFESRL